MTSLLELGSIGLQKYSQVKNAIAVRARSIRNSPLIRPEVLHSCPICPSIEATQLRYSSFETPGRTLPSHNKYQCVDCGHVSASWFPSTTRLGKLYEECYPVSITSPNFRIESEIEIASRIVDRMGERVDLLDFSCGDNYPILEEDINGTLHACDIRDGYPYDGDRFFQFNPREEPQSHFDGIFSVDALEHVSELVPTWEYFNKSLREGGLMAHSFPMATTYSRGHHFYRIPFHANLFSDESLNRWADQMGFAYEGAEPLPKSDVGEVHWFRKISELE